MSLKIDFVSRASKKGANKSALCREFGISRETGHKWLRRYEEQGVDGLEDESRRPKISPLSTAEDIVVAIVTSREAHPRWGARKIRSLLMPRFRKQTPSASTVARVLKRLGRVRERRSFRRMSIVERPPTVIPKGTNDVWTVDFKGWWMTTDGDRCDPLTVRDAYSRFVLSAQILKAGFRVDVAMKEFERLFVKYGLPAAIQCDNGPPFICVYARGGLTRLSVWWVTLGIKVIRSRLGHPEDNGAHERMHRDLAEDVQAFPTRTRATAQLACDRWRQEFNHVRPHDALRGRTPAEVYKPSTRRGLRPVNPVYPGHWASRRVTPAGAISLGDHKVFVGRTLTGQLVALEPTAPFRWRLWFHHLDLGELEVATTIEIDDALQGALEKRTGAMKRKAV